MAVVVVNHGTRELLRACLASVEVDQPAEIVVVDNASQDGSVAMVREAFPGVRRCVNEDNIGYGAAANQGIAACSAPHVLLLNSDTTIEPGTLAALSGYLDSHPGVAVVGPRLVYPDGRVQASTYPFPTPLALLVSPSVTGRVVLRMPGIRRRQWRGWAHDRARAAPWVLGAALGIRRRAFAEVGGFDEGFFLYCEETDLCYRLQQAGWQVHFAPVTTVTHVGGGSTVNRRAEMTVRLFEGLQRFYQLHYSRRDLALLRGMIRCLALAWLGRDAWRRRHARDPVEQAQLAEALAAWARLARGGLRSAEQVGRGPGLHLPT